MQEVILAGSMASDDPYPNDIDLAVVLTDVAELPRIARAARQMSSVYHGWEVFVFTPDRRYLGRICHRRECPATQARCDAVDCGLIPFLKNIAGFTFNPDMFLAPALEPLWVRGADSVLLSWRQELKLAPPSSLAREPVRLRCVDCGRRFTFTVAEQKIFSKRGLQQPKRCERCRELRRF